jgi:cytochrome c553
MRNANLILCLLAALAAFAADAARAADTALGLKIYTAKCANCHGAGGEGSRKYKHALVGDRSVAQLADVIRETMPEDSPGSLSVKDATAVAAYVHEAFYSATARERNRPARVELARLTVRQHRNAVADLIGGFRWPGKWGKEAGLKAEYFKNRRFRNEDRVLQRIDPEVAFDFADGSPVPGKIDPIEFSIRWNGTLMVPETGEYEFTVRTEHAARLWINDTRTPLIDAWVKSGNDTEYKASVFLLSGRIYPVRLEYSKAKQGVDDSKNQKKKPKPAKSSIALLWKPPHGTVAPVPSRCLSTGAAPESFVPTAAFPPDDRSYGWERGTSVSKEWDQAATAVALETAAYVAARLNEFAATKDDAPDRVKKVQAFCRRFAERAFRRPLTGGEGDFVDRQFADGRDLETAVKRVVLVTLKSPRFLYREVGGAPEAFDTAARLSFGLWDSLPDAELWKAAETGKLSTREQVAAQAERMLADPKAKDKLRGFLLTWAKADHGLDLAKDSKAFPGFDPAVVADLRTSLELFLDDVVWSEGSDFRRLVEDPSVFVSGRLAKFYGVKAPDAGGWQAVKMEGRAGVLTHPYLMTSFAHNAESSPIHRGVFLARGVLGISLRPPPEAVAPLAPDLHPTLTTRERVTLQTRPAGCMTCHGVINPLGFTLEQFDAVGRLRDKDHGKPVDATGSYRTRDGKNVNINGARELAAFVAGSPEAHEAFAEQLFHHLVQQPVRAYGPTRLEELRKRFAADGFHIRKLAVEILAATALTPRAATASATKGK